MVFGDAAEIGKITFDRVPEPAPTTGCLSDKGVVDPLEALSQPGLAPNLEEIIFKRVADFPALQIISLETTCMGARGMVTPMWKLLNEMRKLPPP